MMLKHLTNARSPRRLAAMLAVSLLTVAACSDSGGVPGGSSVVGVKIVTMPNLQTTTNLIPGQTRQMFGVPVNSADNWVDRPVSWQSSTPAVATITADGLVTAVAGGTTYIRATAAGRTDSIAIRVRFPVGTIQIAPATVTLTREATQALTATTLDTEGATVTGRTLVWSTSDATIATVSAAGLVSASATNEGTATITATVANASDGGTVVTATRTVTVAGNPVVANIVMGGAQGFHGNAGTVQLTASPRSGLNNVIVTPVTWISSSPAIATVDATGLVTFAGGAGNVTITAQATGAGAGGNNVDGTRVFDVAEILVNGVTANPPTIAGGSWHDYAFSASEVGVTEFVVAINGGTGDTDMFIFNPGVTNPVASAAGGSGWVCRPFLIGSTETCTFGAAAPSPAVVSGWYRIRLFAYPDDGPVTGLNVNLTHP